MYQQRLAEAISAARARVEGMRAAAAHASRPRVDDESMLADLARVSTELAAVEEQLQGSEDDLVSARAALEGRFHRYHDLFEFMPDGYLVTGADGVIRDANRAAIALLAASREQVVGRPLASFAARPERGLVRHQLVVARRATVAQPVEFEVTLQPQGRPAVPAALTIAPVRGDDDRPCGFRILLRDVSERHRIEDTARAASVAEAANAAKDEFLATLSHELRNPLNAILGWAGILRSETLGGEQHAMALETIDRNAHQLNRLIGDLLDVSRIAQRKLLFEPQPCDLVTVVAGAFESVRGELARRQQRFSVKLHDPGAVHADPTRLQQIVSNLLGNAVKFTPAGGAIDLRVDVDDGEIEIVVQDTGMGIAAELLPQIFDRFRQGDSAPTERGGGLGLGLPIARTLARMHGGDLWADSAGVGRGATFTVRLPLRRREDAARKGPRAARRWPSLSPLGSHLALLSGFHVMVAGPDRDTTLEFARHLDLAGATVELVSSPGEIVLDHAGRKPDALVVVVPGSTSGVRMLAEATALEKQFNGSLPVLAITPSRVSARRWLSLPAEVELCTRHGLEPGLLPSRLAVLAQVSGWASAH